MPGGLRAWRPASREPRCRRTVGGRAEADRDDEPASGGVSPLGHLMLSGELPAHFARDVPRAPATPVGKAAFAASRGKPMAAIRTKPDHQSATFPGRQENSRTSCSVARATWTTGTSGLRAEARGLRAMKKAPRWSHGRDRGGQDQRPPGSRGGAISPEVVLHARTRLSGSSPAT